MGGMWKDYKSWGALVSAPALFYTEEDGAMVSGYS
jgi:hypothetical protein